MPAQPGSRGEPRTIRLAPLSGSICRGLLDVRLPFTPGEISNLEMITFLVPGFLVQI